jgi:hypothetical protein
MENEFDVVMQKRTDAELFKILNGAPDDYQPIALEAAKREFARRNLSEHEVATAKQEVEQKQAIDETKANMPLDTGYKIVAFILPGIILLMLSGVFKADGYDRKARELVTWTLYGFGFYIGIIVLINVLSAVF